MVDRDGIECFHAVSTKIVRANDSIAGLRAHIAGLEQEIMAQEEATLTVDPVPEGDPLLVAQRELSKALGRLSALSLETGAAARCTSTSWSGVSLAALEGLIHMAQRHTDAEADETNMRAGGDQARRSQPSDRVVRSITGESAPAQRRQDVQLQRDEPCRVELWLRLDPALRQVRAVACVWDPASSDSEKASGDAAHDVPESLVHAQMLLCAVAQQVSIIREDRGYCCTATLGQPIPLAALRQIRLLSPGSDTLSCTVRSGRRVMLQLEDGEAADAFLAHLDVHLTDLKRIQVGLGTLVASAQSMQAEAVTEDAPDLLAIAAAAGIEPTIPSSAWSDALGFQGKSPLSDFRGAGSLALHWLRVLVDRHGIVADREYPFACGAINVCFRLVQALQPGSDEIVFLSHLVATLVHDQQLALECLFCATFLLMDELFVSRSASYMQFNAILDEAMTTLARSAAKLDARFMQKALDACPQVDE
jgi:hypothetical protein